MYKRDPHREVERPVLLFLRISLHPFGILGEEKWQKNVASVDRTQYLQMSFGRTEVCRLAPDCFSLALSQVS